LSALLISVSESWETRFRENYSDPLGAGMAQWYSAGLRA
jgi:hypothetical protein